MLLAPVAACSYLQGPVVDLRLREIHGTALLLAPLAACSYLQGPVVDLRLREMHGTALRLELAAMR